MSYAVIDIIVGVPLNDAVRKKMREWENDGDERWDDDGCGFETLYSAGGESPYGYCGVKVDSLETYTPQLVSSLKQPTREQIEEAEKLVAKLDPELRKLAGDFGVYFIWSDA